MVLRFFKRFARFAVPSLDLSAASGGLSMLPTILSIPAEKLSGLDVYEGDTLHILPLKETAFLFQISRIDAIQKTALT